MKIDIFTHVIPERYKKELSKYASHSEKSRRMLAGAEAISNLETRFRIMDKYEDYMQVITISGGPIEAVAKGNDAVELAKVCNDEAAALVAKYPYRFLSAVANLPLDDTDAALKELDRAINVLKLKGIVLHTPLYFYGDESMPPQRGKPLDFPELMPIYAKMAEYNLPIWIHPNSLCDARIPDYGNETEAKYYAWQIYGWPYQDTLAQVRLVFSGILEKYPNLKFINHHAGAMIPFFEGRLLVNGNNADMRWGENLYKGLTKHPLDYFKLFYSDTAIGGSTPALMCAHAFYGADHLLFGSDMPFDMETGNESIRETIDLSRGWISRPRIKRLFLKAMPRNCCTSLESEKYLVTHLMHLHLQSYKRGLAQPNFVLHNMRLGIWSVFLVGGWKPIYVQS